MACVQRAVIPPLLAGGSDALHAVSAGLPCRVIVAAAAGKKCCLLSHGMQLRRAQDTPALPACRFGGVEAVAAGKTASWALGRRLPQHARRLLFWLHMLAVNGTSIGEHAAARLLPTDWTVSPEMGTCGIEAATSV